MLPALLPAFFLYFLGQLLSNGSVLQRLGRSAPGRELSANALEYRGGHRSSPVMELERSAASPAICLKAVDQAPGTIAQSSQKSAGLPGGLKLLIGAGGIYASFLYYGSLQEDVFQYVAKDGSKFKDVWFLQVLEALVNAIVGFVGWIVTQGTSQLPHKSFALTGLTQVGAKYSMNMALAAGLSFPVVTLAKSGKMIPVMAGSLLLGGATYTMREYLQVLAIVAGTIVVSLSKKKSAGKADTMLGYLWIALSLTCDGLTGGVQKRIKAQAVVKPKPYDMMLWTNTYMLGAAAVFALLLGELVHGVDFCYNNPVILEKIIKFAACSAFGQSFIFYTIATFDPLVCTTVTTTRKIFSVLLSIFLKGHSLNFQGWSGVTMASAGIIGEVLDKALPHSKASQPKATCHP
eukprot:gnl/MRDRNA2_/MRDRNA2_27349_c0_seq1.p1 gnl/MRDRNA2_/MRDRNA2_27349_c0~~gnl/MRDRNA2_/MRDRNA2_27349_c0_seq1.p1  ORF type:complete len:405 (-),score=56.18 gnl/MRDRNA2_/MRDRNA2_27349_c0_seq1:67-1281(-)